MAEGRKRSLIRTFARVAAKTLAVAALAYGAWFGAFYAGRGDALTTGEKQTVESIFGDQLDASKIRKHFKEESHFTHVLKNKRGVVLPPFSHIDFFGRGNWSQDFSRESRDQFGFFLHEVTHTWQGQNFKFSAKNFGIYEYAIPDTLAKFSDFGTEQQAEIIEDYSKRWIHSESVTQPRTANDTLLMKVVERQFPRAAQTRDSIWRAHAPKATALKT